MDQPEIASPLLPPGVAASALPVLAPIAPPEAPPRPPRPAPDPIATGTVLEVEKLPAGTAPEPAAPPAALEGFGLRVRRRLAERRYHEHSELVPNSDGYVYGPSRAEIILALLRAGAWSPLVGWFSAGFAYAIELKLVGQPSTSAKAFLSRGATGVLAFALLDIRKYVRRRKLLRVRARVFENGQGPTHHLLLCTIYAVLALLVLFR